MACPENAPPPPGYRVWRGAVPQPLTLWAVSLRDNEIGRARYGATWTQWYGDQAVLARKDHHTWTYRNGQLVTGLCIPGITLYQAVGASGGVAASGVADNLDTPDPTAAVYPVDRGTDWALVGVSTAAIAATVTAFLLALKYAGRASRRHS